QGKTTFARILAGFENPIEGTVTLGGLPVKKKGYQPIQLVFQHPEKAINPRWKMQKSLREGWEPDRALLEAFGIEQEWLTRWPNELSGGELQR
ncbi:ATP-binding cassette domain-containing protein, partial [Staphylococcus sp. SIMBA_130]